MKKGIRKATSGFLFLKAQTNREKKGVLNRELITIIVSSIKVMFSVPVQVRGEIQMVHVMIYQEKGGNDETYRRQY